METRGRFLHLWMVCSSKYSEKRNREKMCSRRCCNVTFMYFFSCGFICLSEEAVWWVMSFYSHNNVLSQTSCLARPVAVTLTATDED